MVGMVLHMCKKDHRAIALLHTISVSPSTALQAQDSHQFIYDSRHSVPGSKDHVVGTRIHMLLYQIV